MWVVFLITTFLQVNGLSVRLVIPYKTGSGRLVLELGENRNVSNREWITQRILIFVWEVLNIFIVYPRTLCANRCERSKFHFCAYEQWIGHCICDVSISILD